MPELPEVETVRRGMERVALHRRIADVIVLKPQLIKPPVENPVEFAECLRGRQIENVRRRGKHLIFGLDNGYALLTHLKMRGSIRFVATDSVPVEPYLGLQIKFEDGSQFRYHDIWGWGEFRYIKDTAEDLQRSVPALAEMGIEPFDADFSWEALREAASRRVRTTIKAALLDQSVLAGVGNIYADESLFRAGINPARRVGDLGQGEWSKLRDEIVAVLTEATEGGGTRSEDYVNPAGEAGAYQPRVYARDGQPCLNCGESLVRIKITGRGTVYCPKCQFKGDVPD